MKVLLKRPGEGPTTGVFYPKSGRLFRGLLVGVLAVTLIGAPSVGFAGEKAASVSRESGLGAAAAISSLVYGPVKVFYALGGLVIGSFAWVFTAGDSEVAEMVFTRSLRGTYVITPEILDMQPLLRSADPDAAVRAHFDAIHGTSVRVAQAMLFCVFVTVMEMTIPMKRDSGPSAKPGLPVVRPD